MLCDNGKIKYSNKKLIILEYTHKKYQIASY